MTLTTSPPLVGSVAPTHLSHPPRVDSAGPEAVALAASAGLHLDGWQARVLDVALGEREDGKWASREVALVVPRQNGKGSVLEALIVAALFLFDEHLILYSAHEFKTAQETYLRVKALIESSDDLMRRVLKFHNAHGAEGVELRNGNRLRFVARTKGSGRGFSPSRVILDEALNLSKRSVSALLFSMSAQPNPQLWYASSHPENDAPEGDVLREVMRRGRAGDDSSLAYLEWCADDEVDPDDRDQWAQANPGYPHRIGDETIETERQAVSDVAEFKRERLGVIDLTVATGEQIISPAAWETCRQPNAERGDRVEYALDASPDLKSAAISASDGRVVLVLEHHPGFKWVTAALRDILIDRPGRVWLDPRSPAGALIVDLDEAGIEHEPVSAADHAQACGAFLGACEAADGSLVHYGQPALDAAAEGATRRPYGDSWAWNRRTSAVDISPLVSVTIARWAALQQAEEAAPVYAY